MIFLWSPGLKELGPSSRTRGGWLLPSAACPSYNCNQGIKYLFLSEVSENWLVVGDFLKLINVYFIIYINDFRVLDLRENKLLSALNVSEIK